MEWYGNVTGERSGCGVVWECDRREVRLWEQGITYSSSPNTSLTSES